MNHIELGKAGEHIAAEYLRKKHHRIIATNFRFRRGEIDIISLHNNKLVATEVKTRETAQFGSPYAAVSRTKQRQIISVMNAFIEQSKHKEDVQFDVVSIVLGPSKTEIEHIEDAFYPLI